MEKISETLQKYIHMFIIGLTGSVATGKSTVATMFKELGAKIIDADKIVHDLLKNNVTCKKEIACTFKNVLNEESNIDRKALAQSVFNNITKLRKLERIIHPRVRREINKQLKRYKTRKIKVVVLDIPLLFEGKYHKITDSNVVVKATQELQIKRVIKRLNISKSEALQRIRTQMTIQHKIRLADHVIDNRGTITQTKKQVKHIFQNLCI
ncbi:MAG: dephospho-CoA kinase [Candidatus Omnitrophota bacterium]|jgi:dephospho-CoA kinase